MDQADMTDLANISVRTEDFLHACGQPKSCLFRFLQDVFLVEDVEHGERRRAAKRIARVGVAVHERLPFAPVRVEGVVDLLFDDGDGHRHVAARQALGKAHDVGRDARTLRREEPARPAEARRDLIGNEEHVMLVAERTQFLEVKLRIDSHARAALQKRLDDHRRTLFGVLGKRLCRIGKTLARTRLARLLKRTSVAIGRFDVDVVHHHGLVHLGEKIHRADGERTDRLAVIALRKA